MTDEDIITRIRKAKVYADAAMTVCERIFNEGHEELMLEGLQAVHDTATDLAYESWSLRMDFLEAMGRIKTRGETIGSFLGTRKIPEIEENG